MATVGGNLAHGDPANDHPATMLALGAQVAAVGPSGERVIPVSDFLKARSRLLSIMGKSSPKSEFPHLRKAAAAHISSWSGRWAITLLPE